MSRPLNIAFMTEIKPLRTTVAMMKEALARGHNVYSFESIDLSVRDGHVSAYAHRVRAVDWENRDVPLIFDEEPQDYFLDHFQAVLIREDKPFNMELLSSLYLLEQYSGKCMIINRPNCLRRLPGKIIPLYFPDLTPNTLITHSRHQVEKFLETHPDIIIKPLYGTKGYSVFHIDSTSKNLPSLMQTLEKVYKEPYVVQAFVPEAVKGDKRIMLIEGEPIAAVFRTPPPTDVRSNLDAGGTAEISTLNDRDRLICRRLKPFLLKNSLDIVGIDVIGDYLIEVNTFSPGGFGAIPGDGIDLIAQKTISLVERRLSNPSTQKAYKKILSRLFPGSAIKKRLLSWVPVK